MSKSMRFSAEFSGKAAVSTVAGRATSHGIAELQRRHRGSSGRASTLQLARRATIARKWVTLQENARKQAAVAHRGLGNNRARAKEEPGHSEEVKETGQLAEAKAKAADHLIGDRVEHR